MSDYTKGLYVGAFIANLMWTIGVITTHTPEKTSTKEACFIFDVSPQPKYIEIDEIADIIRIVV